MKTPSNPNYSALTLNLTSKTTTKLTQPCENLNLSRYHRLTFLFRGIFNTYLQTRVENCKIILFRGSKLSGHVDITLARCESKAISGVFVYSSHCDAMRSQTGARAAGTASWCHSVKANTVKSYISVVQYFIDKYFSISYWYIFAIF